MCSVRELKDRYFSVPMMVGNLIAVQTVEWLAYFVLFLKVSEFCNQTISKQISPTEIDKMNLRVCPREHQTVVLYAIPPISMKPC